MTPRIRPEQHPDEAAIEAVTRAAFLEAEHTSHTEQDIVRALRRSGALALSLVAIDVAGEVIGHVAISRVTISDGSGDWYGLGPISVQPAMQRCGVGTALMDKALAELRGRGAAGCVLVGDPRYYGRFGFLAESRLVYPGVPPEYFQALRWRGDWPRGVVTYHEAFG